LYSALLWEAPLLRRSDMGRVQRGDHTVLPATHTWTIPAFTPQPKGITTLWLVLIALTHEGITRLSWLGCSATYEDKCPAPGIICHYSFKTHPSLRMQTESHEYMSRLVTCWSSFWLLEDVQSARQPPALTECVQAATANWCFVLIIIIIIQRRCSISVILHGIVYKCFRPTYLLTFTRITRDVFTQFWHC